MVAKQVLSGGWYGFVWGDIKRMKTMEILCTQNLNGKNETCWSRDKGE
jgi:hypothetical protein